MENIEIKNNIGESVNSFLSSSKYSQIGLLCDENTAEYCMPLLSDYLPELWIIEIKSGEENKNLQTCEQIWTALTEWGFDRNSLLINLGGGVIGDMGGFVASTYKRGMDFINIPTTLLSQVDASVGGKLGVDFMGLKNHIGIFQEPQKVFIDANFLATLPKNELRSGFAEIIKHGLIADADYWNEIKEFSLANGDWTQLINKSVQIKHAVVTQDPREAGLRKILNFGHTIGHGIESAHLEDKNGRLLHGEAIAVGMICEAYLSTKLTGLGKNALDDINKYILSIFKSKALEKSYFEKIIELIYQDKKNDGRTINCSLLQDVGSCTINIPLSESDILDSLFYFNKLVGK